MSIFIFILFFLFLLFSKYTIHYASLGLTMWFQNMIPALFPFMILSGIIIKQNYAEKITKLFHPILHMFYQTSEYGSYCILSGFLCGFPMGAKSCCDFYKRGQISKNEAEYLLAFCNQLSPAYYIGFLLPLLQINTPCKIAKVFLGIYGIPLFYGIILRFILKSCFTMKANKKENEEQSLLNSIQESVSEAVSCITILGAYMIIANVMMVVPHAFIYFLNHLQLFCPYTDLLLKLCHLLLEINGGICAMGNTLAPVTLGILPFGGMSCLLQIKYTLKDTDLSFQKYMMHSIIQTLIAFFYFFLFL